VASGVVSEVEAGVSLVVLENERVRAEIAPEQGARVVSLLDRASNRELLYSRAGATWDPGDYLATLAGGWDQMFPNDDPWAGLPGHGTLWSTPFTAQRPSSTAVALRCRLETPEVDVEHSYQLLEAPRAGVRLTTTVRARAEVEPFLWASHPMLSIAPGWRIAPGDGPLEADRIDPGRAAPGPVSAADRETVLELPAGSQGWQEVIYADAAGNVSVASSDGGSTTRVAWDTEFFGNLWIVTLSGFESIDLALVLEPCTTRPYRLDEAIAGGHAMTLSPGTECTFWSEVESLDVAS
jgi:hypothetical protein